MTDIIGNDNKYVYVMRLGNQTAVKTTERFLESLIAVKSPSNAEKFVEWRWKNMISPHDYFDFFMTSHLFEDGDAFYTFNMTVDDDFIKRLDDAIKSGKPVMKSLNHLSCSNNNKKAIKLTVNGDELNEGSAKNMIVNNYGEKYLRFTLDVNVFELNRTDDVYFFEKYIEVIKNILCI
jgi:hypothetical protein